MRNYRYIILVSVTAALLGAILIFAKKPKKVVPNFRERTGSIAMSAEWLDTKKAIQDLLKAIELNDDDNASKLKLAQAYIQEARITGDHAYYDNVCIELLDDVLKAEPKNFDALCCKSTVLLSQHHFTDGLVVAQQATPINPNSAYVYGLMCDAYVELGKYDSAVIMCDKMISIRPDIRSYSRVSYLREIHGDYKGAIQAAQLAVKSGYPGLEQSEFARIVLAHLYLSTGKIDSAQYQYKLALNERPAYAFGIAGLGHIEKIKGNYKQAITYLEQAKKLIVEYSFSDELTDVYLLNKEIEKSKKTANEVVAMLSPLSNDDESSSAHGHYADKELAYAYLKLNDVDNALTHALLEYERRPANIDICEMMGWVNYKKGNYAEANNYINTALKTNSKSPVLLCHAGLIKIKAGEQQRGVALIKKGLEINPFMEDLELKKEALKYISSK